MLPPAGSHSPQLVEKIKDMNFNLPEWSDEEIRAHILSGRSWRPPLNAIVVAGGPI